MKYGEENETLKPVETRVNNAKKHNKENETKPIDTTVSSTMIHTDMVEYEILSRLPVKSLMRFKCVSKRWESLIKEDAKFISLHLTRSKLRPCLLIVTASKPVRHWGDYLGEESQSHEFFSSTNLLRREDEAITIFKTMKTNDLGDNILILKSVNGLICIVYYGCISKKWYDVVRIYNPSTREFPTQWIKPYVDNSRGDMEYRFGFDPVTKEHKVICLWEERGSSSIICEVLTVGQTTWRRIHDQVPSYGFIHGHSVYSGGCVYWSNKCTHRYKEEADVLVVFDVGLEKFSVISVPNLINNDRPLDTGNVYNGLVVDLLEVNGRVAVLCKMSNDTVKLCISDDHHSNKNWTEVTITLPFCWTEDKSLYFNTVPGTDLIILETYEIDDIPDRQIGSIVLYTYDWNNKTFRKVKIDGIPSSTRCQPSEHACSGTRLFTPVDYSVRDRAAARVTLFAPFVESLWPVRKQGVPCNATPQTYQTE